MKSAVVEAIHEKTAREARRFFRVLASTPGRRSGVRGRTAQNSASGKKWVTAVSAGRFLGAQGSQPDALRDYSGTVFGFKSILAILTTIW